MQDDFLPGWNCVPRVRQHSYHAALKQFNFLSDTYDNWAWLALETGRFWFKMGKEEGEVLPGDWIFCPPRVALQRKMLMPCSFHFMRLDFDADVPQTLAGHHVSRDLARQKLNFAALRAGAFNAQATVWKEHLMLDIFRAALWEKHTGVPRQPADAAMEKVKSWLLENATSAVSMARLAEELRLSPVAFSRRFQAATGQAPSAFLLETRLETARTLLIETDLTLDTIAARSGFKTGFYLSRVWSKNFGQSPSRFRRAHRV